MYLGTEGVTSTAANYVANLAKEMMYQEMSFLDNVNFVEKKIGSLDNTSVHVVNNGYKEKDLEKIKTTLFHVEKMKTLIGWLREAMKEKERMIEHTKRLFTFEISKILGEDYEIKQPTCKRIDESDYIKTLPVDTQIRIHFLQSQTAILGKYVHENGALNKARRELINSINSPSSVKECVKVTVTHFSPSVETEKVDKVFFEIQKKYRETQKELNILLHSVKEEVRKENIRLQSEYDRERNKVSDWNAKRDEKCENWRRNEIDRISELKIVVPEELQDLFNEINNLGGE